MCRFFFVISLFFLISCKQNKPDEIPENILAKDKMILVLTDMHILESAINLNLVSANFTANDSVMFYNVFENNHTSKKQYEESLNFYKSHPKLLNELYDSVLVLLSRKQAEETGVKK
jgi:hypothetical protein